MQSGTYTDPRRKKSAHRMGRRLACADDPGAGRCVIGGCGRPTQATVGKGFSALHCRYHIQLKNRHGSFWKKTYTAPQLAPYRGEVERYLRANASLPELRTTLEGIRLMYWQAGRPVRVIDAKTMRPDEKARGVLARMNRAGVAEVRVLINHLAVTAAVREDPIGPGGPPDEFRLVQIAKACLRLASGEAPGVLRHHPRSSGLMLRVLGRRIDAACADFASRHLEHILAARAARQATRSAQVSDMQAGGGGAQNSISVEKQGGPVHR